MEKAMAKFYKISKKQFLNDFQDTFPDYKEKTIKMYRAGKEKPRLESLMAIFIGLQLKEQYCDHMLDLLCYSLRDMDNKQKVYRYLIRNHMDSNLEHWNQMLKMFELPTIPKKKIS